MTGTRNPRPGLAPGHAGRASPDRPRPWSNGELIRQAHAASRHARARLAEQPDDDEPVADDDLALAHEIAQLSADVTAYASSEQALAASACDASVAAQVAGLQWRARALVAAFAGEWSQQARDKAASSRESLPDGSFPIRDREDLRRAVKAYGRARDKARARAHIIRRARALDAVELLPSSWGVTAAAPADDVARTARARRRREIQRRRARLRKRQRSLEPEAVAASLWITPEAWRRRIALQRRMSAWRRAREAQRDRQRARVSA